MRYSVFDQIEISGEPLGQLYRERLELIRTLDDAGFTHYFKSEHHMGMGFGAAMGAAKAAPGRSVVCITGDGAAGFTIGEFEAMVRHDLPIVVVVMNNARWGASQGFQMRPDGRHRAVGTTLSDASYDQVMVAFGGRGVRVNTLDGLAHALDDALDSHVATCINVSTNNVGLAPEIPQLNGP